MIKNISNLGDAALYCDFGSEVNKEINSKVIRYFKSIKKENIDGINNLTPSYNKLIISFDLRKKNFQTIKKIIENFGINYEYFDLEDIINLLHRRPYLLEINNQILRKRDS